MRTSRDDVRKPIEAFLLMNCQTLTSFRFLLQWKVPADAVAGYELQLKAENLLPDDKTKAVVDMHSSNVIGPATPLPGSRLPVAGQQLPHAACPCRGKAYNSIGRGREDGQLPALFAWREERIQRASAHEAALQRDRADLTSAR